MEHDEDLVGIALALSITFYFLLQLLRRPLTPTTA
jgi:hypothetical protein